MSETFRYAEAGEVGAIARLVAHSFPQRNAAYWEEVLSDGWHGGRESLWVAIDDGRPVAACQILRLRQWLGGASIPVMGLGAVTVALTHRRRGLAARLCASALAEARGRGDVGSALYPFRTEFYRRLGYGLAGAAHQFRIPTRRLPDAEERSAVRLADDPSTLASVREFYGRWIRTQNGQMERTERSWRKVLDRDALVAVFESGGEVEGYLVVRFREDLPPAERFLEIEEAAWGTAAARRGLFSWIGSLGDQWREVVYRAHPQEGFEDLVGDVHPPIPSDPAWALWYHAGTVLRGPMFRLLNLETALGSGRRFGEGIVDLVLEMEDPQLGPAEPVAVRFEDGVAAIGAHASGAARLIASVETVSRIYAGDLVPSIAAARGLARIEGAAPAVLDRVFRLVPTPWTFDRF